MKVFFLFLLIATTGWADKSVKDFGAVGDGVTDDTAAITNALAAITTGDTLLFPGGVYRINPQISLTLKSNMNVNLAGSIVKADNVNGAACRIFRIATARNVRIYGGTLQGSRTGTPLSGEAISVSNGVEIVLEDLQLKDCFSDGLRITGSNRLSVRGCVFENCGGSVVAGSEVSFTDCDFLNGPGDGLKFQPAVSNLNVRSCTFTGNAGNGLTFVNAGQATVIDCLFDGNQTGLLLSNAPSIVLLGNRILNHPEAGVQVVGSSKVTATGNLLANNARGFDVTGSSFFQANGNNLNGANTGDGFHFTDSGDAAVRKNIVRNHGNGIYASNAKRLHITGNNVVNNQQRGIHLLTVSDSLVSGNILASNGLAAVGAYEDLRLEQDCRTNSVTFNLFRGVNTTSAGIAIPDVGSTGNHVTGNDLGASNRLSIVASTLLNWDTSTNNWNRGIGGVPVPDPFAVWQLWYFGCTGCPQAAGAADPDGDGQSNTNEFLAGTTPTNIVSALRIIGTTRVNNDVTITWTTARGKTNAVQAAGNVGSFFDIATFILAPGTGDLTTNFTEFGGAANVPARFYRIKLVP